MKPPIRCAVALSPSSLRRSKRYRGTRTYWTTGLHVFPPKPGIEWEMANYRGFLGTGLFFAANPQAGVVLDCFSKTAGPVRVTVKDQARRGGRGESHRVGYAVFEKQ